MRRTRICACAIIVSVVFLLASCGGTGKQNTVTPSVTVTGVNVLTAPSGGSMFVQKTFQVSANVTMSDGSTTTAVTWSVQEGAAGGSITAAGLYTAPNAAATVHVIATAQADSTKSSSSTVAVKVPRAPSFTSSPPAAVVTGGTYTYTVAATDPEGTAITYALGAGSPGPRC